MASELQPLSLLQEYGRFIPLEKEIPDRLRYLLLST